MAVTITPGKEWDDLDLDDDDVALFGQAVTVFWTVADLERASALYAELFGQEGRRLPGARHYFDCGGVIVAVLDVSQGGMPPTPGPKSLSFAGYDYRFEFGQGFHSPKHGRATSPTGMR